MWSTAGAIPDAASAARNASASAVASGFAAQPRGFREKIWNVSQPIPCARSTAFAMEPAIETWTPTLTIPHRGAGSGIRISMARSAILKCSGGQLGKATGR